MDAIKNIILDGKEEELAQLLSPFIKEQFPDFVKTDYPKLILLMKAYYEWLEQKGNPGYIVSKLDTIYDIDKNGDEFYDHFASTYLEGFPSLLAIDEDGNRPNKKTLLKKIRDFYGNKGTESAYRFLFRILYDSEVEIYYPKTDILKASDGVWVEPRSIKTTVVNGTSLFSGRGGQIYQYRGQSVVASAFIDTVVQYSFDGIPICEFFITDINGTFTPDAEVKIVNGGSEWTETAYSVLGSFYVELPGNGYRVGDTVTVIDSRGRGFSAKIDQTGLAGSVKRIGISNSGINYPTDLVVNIFNENGSHTAKVVALRGAVTAYPGYFSGNSGKLSANKKIQDGNYYQDFSYQLKSALSFDSYFSVLKKIIHPAGMRMFGSVLLKSVLGNTFTNSTQSTVYSVPIIGRYTPYTSGTTFDLRNNGVTISGYWLGATGDLYPLGYNPYIGSTAQIGPNGKTTSVGTVFVGTSLGYTMCYVPEGGKTSHNPIGSPLGSTVSWYSGNEASYSPQGMRGLVLWLKPENIGVCGAVVNGASVDVWRDASPRGNDAVPPTWGRFNGSAYSGAGITIDRLRPQMIAASIAGPTGVCFNGGVLYAPTTVWNGASLAQWIQLGNTHGAGTTAERILTGQHLYLKNALNLPDEAEIFMVIRPTVEGYDKGLGLFSSDAGLTSYKRDDTVLYHRSYNPIDRNTALWNSTYYKVLPNDTLLYPSLSPTGLIGFRPSGSRVDVDRTTIAYDPHVSGVCFGTAIGHWTRDETARIRSYLNGNESTNYSFSSGRRIASVGYPNLENYLINAGLLLWLDSGDSSSYSGSGTIWNDISGSGLTASISGAVYKNNVNEPRSGIFDLDGVDDFITIPTLITSSLNQVTFEMVFKSSVAGNSSTGYLIWDHSGGNPIWFGKTSNNRWMWFWNFNAGRAKSASVSASSYVANTWIHVAIRASLSNTVTLPSSDNYSELIINGSVYSDQHQNMNDLPLGYPSTPIYIGRRASSFGNGEPGSPVSNYSDIEIGQFRVYDRILSRQEVRQNFSAIRERYGL